MTVQIIDSAGKMIEVGSRVDGGTWGEGTVVAISDPDGDVNEYGLPVAINPRVQVHWDRDAEPEPWGDAAMTRWTARGPGDEAAPYECEDVLVIPEPSVTQISGSAEKSEGGVA